MNTRNAIKTGVLSIIGLKSGIPLNMGLIGTEDKTYIEINLTKNILIPMVETDTHNKCLVPNQYGEFCILTAQVIKEQKDKPNLRVRFESNILMCNEVTEEHATSFKTQIEQRIKDNPQIFLGLDKLSKKIEIKV